MKFVFSSSLLCAAFSLFTGIQAENPPANCTGNETFRFIVQGSTNGGSTWSSTSANVYANSYTAPDINLTIRTLMTVTSGQTQGWSFSMKHDPSWVKYYGGDFTLSSVTTSGTDTATVQDGSPPDTNETHKRTGFYGYTQGIVIDGGAEITLDPATNFVTSKACYKLKFPRYSNYAQVTLKFTHDIGTPTVRSLITQEGESNIPCAQNFTFYIYIGSYYPTVGGCPAGMTLSVGGPGEGAAGDSLLDSNQTLPGPGIDLAVDIDGDGVSSFQDKYFFNLWLEKGGNLDSALAAAEKNGDVLDLSKFTQIRDVQSPPPEDTAESSSPPSILDTISSDIEIVKRIPPSPEPSCGQGCEPISRDPRVTPDGHYVVFSSRATNITADNTYNHYQIYRYDNQNSTALLISQVNGSAFDDADSLRPIAAKITQPLFR